MASSALVDLARELAPEAPSVLVDALDRAWITARAAHGAIPLDPETFARHVVHHCGIDARAIDAAHVADLYLALGCARGDAAALAQFEVTHLREVPAFVAHLRLDRNAVEELLQSLRERLLAPRRDGGPRILGFTGRGPLGGWVRVSSVRLAVDLAAEHAPTATDDPISTAFAGPDPELELARLHASQAFKTAFEASLAAIDAEERTVLRMHFVDGLSIDEIGVAYGVHRATAARWLATGREKIASLTRKQLRQSLKLEPSDLESVLRLVESQIDLSLGRLLQ